MGSVCWCVCWKSSVWMLILVQCTSSPLREQVWGWCAAEAENSGVILILGLYPVRLCPAGKRKAVGFNAGRKHQDLVPCINRVVGRQGCGGSSTAGMGSPLQCCKVCEKKGKKRRNWRKMQISFRFGSKQRLCLLPAPSVPAGLCPPPSNPFTVKNKPEPLQNPISLGEWKNTTSWRWKCQSVGARGREEQRVASANCRKSDTVIQSCSGREGALVDRWEKWSWIPFISTLLSQHGQIVSHFCCPSLPSCSKWD